MKSLTLILVLTVIISQTAHSQFTLGVGGMVQNTSLAGDDPSDGYLRAGVGFGGSMFASIGLPGDIDLFVQPGYDMRKTIFSYDKAFRIDGEKVDSTVDSASLSTTYITIPIGIRVFNGRHNWFFSTGVSLNLRQSGELSVKDSVVQTEVPALKTEDVMLFAGVGFLVPIGPLNLALEARYQLGLMDVVDEVNSTAFVKAPIIRQSGLLVNLSVEVPFGDGSPDVADSSKKNNVGPRLGEHLFSLPVNMLSPFVRTVTTFNIGGGQTTGIDFPNMIINDNITIAPAGDLLFLTVVARHEQKIKEWMSFHAYLSSIARVGTNVTSLLSQGVNSIVGFGLGWNIKIVETEKIAFVTGLDFRQSSITSISINRWLEGVIDSGKVTADNPLIDTKPTLRAVGSVRGAWSINTTFGVAGSIEGGYGEASARGTESSLALSAQLAGSIDLNPSTDVPLGITVGGGYRQSPEAADGTSEESKYVMLRIGQTGTEHFALGAQLTWLFSSIQDVDPSLSVVAIGLDMKFYY